MLIGNLKMLLYWFSFLKIILASDVMWKKAHVEKDRIIKDSIANAVNEIIEALGQDRNQVCIKSYFYWK